MKWRTLNQNYQNRLDALAALTPHQLLGVRGDVTEPELRAAYLALIKAYHPDQSDVFMRKYNQEATKLINKAYATLRQDKN